MTRMKESGIDWIGQIPEEWEVIKVKFFTYMKGRIGWQGLKADEFIDEGPYLVTGTDFKNGRVNWDTAYHISQKRYEQAPEIQLKHGDLLVTKDGTVGKLALIDELPDSASLNSHLLVLRPLFNRYDNHFLYYVLSSLEFKNYFQKVSIGSTMDSLSQEKMGEFIFALPNINEQNSISRYLDKKTAQLDKAKALLEEQIQKLKDYRVSLIYETVTKGLDKTVPMKDSDIDWIGQVPQGWEVSKIKFTTQLNGRIGWQGLTSAEYKEEGPYLITGTDFHNETINFETAVHIDEKRWTEASQIQVENGDLLITKDGTVGKVAIISGLDDKASLNSGVLRIQTIDEIDRKFLYYVLLSDEFWMWFNYTNSGASTILHLYQNVFDEFTFTFPQKNEQTKISDFLDKKTYQIDQLIQIKYKQIDNINKQRQTLIYDYVTGKRRV